MFFLFVEKKWERTNGRGRVDQKKKIKNEGWSGFERHKCTHPNLFLPVTWSLERGLFMLSMLNCGVSLLHTCSSPSLSYCLFYCSVHNTLLLFPFHSIATHQPRIATCFAMQHPTLQCTRSLPLSHSLPLSLLCFLFSRLLVVFLPSLEHSKTLH